jgi:acetolactate synthase-1/2/3 large subunit
LALIRIKQQRKDYAIYGTAVGSRVRLDAAHVFGVPIAVARNARELDGALAAAALADGPVLIDAHVSSREYDGLVLRKHRRGD